MGTKALTVIVARKQVRGDIDRARQYAMNVAPKEGFGGEPASIETTEDASGEPAWAFFWEREN
jgi:hypothetical protein